MPGLGGDLPQAGPRAADAAMPVDNSDRKFPERRQLTVLFCDLVNSAAISNQLDPEDHFGLLRSYHSCCAKAIGDAGGFVAQFLGDGVVGYFGYEKASESDAERALRAAIELVAAVPNIVTSLDFPLSVRVGVATGLAVVGDPERDGTQLSRP